MAPEADPGISGVVQDLRFKDKDKDKDLWFEDKDKDLKSEDKDKGKDL